MNPIAAIAFSDIHLTHSPPAARSTEEDWYGVMGRYLDQVKEVHSQACWNSQVPIPIIVAGDIFDKPNQPVELINWTIDHFPHCYAIPGQHDLPAHRLEDIKRSAYWTLVKAGVVTHLTPLQSVEVGHVRLHGFPWGTKIRPLSRPHSLLIEIAVLHRYTWVRGASYPEAKKEDRAIYLQEELKGFDIAIIGDNHHPFDVPGDDLCSIVNCGTFMRRKQDERKHKPSVVLIHQDGTTSRKYLDVDNDVFADAKDVNTAKKDKNASDLTSYLLQELGGNAIDFAETLRRWCKDKDEKVKEIVNQLLR